MKPPRALFAGLFAAASCFASIAAAAGTASAADDAPTAAMRKHFANGVRLYDAKSYEQALTEFEAAHDAKPVAAVQRNIALTLERLGRYAEALDALERFAAEAGGDLSPEVKAATDAKIRELAARVATVRVSVKPAGAECAIDGVPLPAERAAAALHLMPGEHVFAARAPGFVAAETRRALSAGEQGLVAIDLPPALAAPLPLAPLPPPAPTEAAAFPSAPPPYEAAVPPQPRSKRAFLELGMTFGGESARLAPSLGGDGTTRQGFGDFALSLGGGKELAPFASLVGYAEVNLANARYTTASTSATPSTPWSVGVADLTLAPGIRLHTLGSRVRFFGDVAAGVDVRWVSATASASPTEPSPLHLSGAGAGLALLADLGLDVRLGDLYLGGALALLTHDVSAVRSAGDALYGDNGATRLGLRLFLGYPF
jgi:hypothetical protein